MSFLGREHWYKIYQIDFTRENKWSRLSFHGRSIEIRFTRLMSFHLPAGTRKLTLCQLLPRFKIQEFALKSFISILLICQLLSKIQEFALKSFISILIFLSCQLSSEIGTKWEHNHLTTCQLHTIALLDIKRRRKNR